MEEEGGRESEGRVRDGGRGRERERGPCEGWRKREGCVHLLQRALEAVLHMPMHGTRGR
jgi:hypothetical protein